MHNLLLGLIHKHFTGILGLSLPVDKDQNPPVLRLSISESFLQLSDNEQKSWKRLVRWLEQPMCEDLNTMAGYGQWLSKLARQHWGSLGLLCHELQIDPIPSHPKKISQPSCKDLARGLLNGYVTCLVVLASLLITLL